MFAVRQHQSVAAVRYAKTSAYVVPDNPGCLGAPNLVCWWCARICVFAACQLVVVSDKQVAPEENKC
jgi:hypothetical protein